MLATWLYPAEGTDADLEEPLEALANFLETQLLPDVMSNWENINTFRNETTKLGRQAGTNGSTSQRGAEDHNPVMR